MSTKDRNFVDVDAEEKEVENEKNSFLSEDGEKLVEGAKKGWNIVKDFALKTSKKIGDEVSNVSDKYSENRKINDKYNEKIVVLKIAGKRNFFGNDLEVKAVVDEKNKTLFFRDTENLDSICCGTILKGDMDSYEIKDIDKNKCEYFYVEVNEVSFEVPGFKATYR